MIGGCRMLRAFAAVVASTGVWAHCTAAAELLLSETEIAAIVRHGPWPEPRSIDPSNRVSGKHDAIELGRALFFDKRLSVSGTVACANCHPNQGNFANFQCTTSCHPSARMDDKHDRVPGYQYQSAACYRCHPNGRKP